MPAEAVAEMNRDFPAYLEEMDPRGVRPPLEGRVATLRTLAGLTMAEIAKAFWSPRRRARWR
jgi:hypothetical protein